MHVSIAVFNLLSSILLYESETLLICFNIGIVFQFEAIVPKAAVDILFQWSMFSLLLGRYLEVDFWVRGWASA